jgi:aspartate carbamoyltransferase catalytic subunit
MEKLSFYHLLDAAQIKDSDINQLIDLAEKYRKQGNEKNFIDANCRGLIAANLFFEASTRTRMSFESAMLRLGGNNITLESGEASSVKKGETLTDTGRIVSNYADIIIVRHPETGSVAELAKYSSVPVINAGDGTNQHPSQSLADLYTIFCEKKRLDNLKIGVLGDLKYGRTVHSLLTLLSRHQSNSLTLISHPSLKVEADYKQHLSAHGCKIIETDDLENSIGELDILYVTRVQQERFPDPKEYEKVKNLYHVDSALLEKAKKNLTIMHPLPRVSEIAIEVDFTDQARYFAQAHYAVYIRMALLYLMTRGGK